MLEITNLVSGYGGDAILRGATLRVPTRAVVTVVGHNGAGKSTLVRTLIGLLPVWDGSIGLDGDDITNANSSHRLSAGLAVSFQDESVFPTLSVIANLRLGGYIHRSRQGWIAERLEHVLAMFPQLRRLLDQAAYTLSGGERRMLSIGMALMSDPKLLVLDEPSTGLSPSMATLVFDTVVDIRDRLGKSVLLIEQNVEQALAIADRAIVLKTGTVIFEGPPASLASDSTELVSMF